MKELNDILTNMGVCIVIEDLPESDSKQKCVKINYDKFEFEKIRARGAGRPSKRMKKTVKTEEICKRMKNETASQVAEDLGISRETLYRKLRAAKQYGYEYL